MSNIYKPFLLTIVKTKVYKIHMGEGINKSGLFQIIALFLLVVVVPAGSWYYLKTGLDYRIATLNEIQDLGKINSFTSVSTTGASVTDDDLEGDVVVVGFLTTSHPELRTIYGKRLNKLQDQFHDRNRVKFAIHSLGNADAGGKELMQFAEAYELDDKSSVLLLTQGDEIAKSNYKLPLEEGLALEDNPYLVLLDTALTIKNYYDIREEAQMKKLVEHLIYILPPDPKKDIYLKRETEK